MCVTEFAFFLWESHCYHSLYKANDNDTEPLIDWEIDYIEFCLHKTQTETVNVCSPSECIKYVSVLGNIKYVENISKIYDTATMEQFVGCINDRTKYISSIPEDFSSLLEKGDYIKIGDEEKSYYLSVRIHFKETGMIMWSSDVILYDNHYYLIDYHHDFEEIDYYIPLTEELEALISSTIESVGASSNETQ